MPRIETTCGACFTRIRVAPADVELRRDELGDRFTFLCPVCGEREVRPADARHLALLGALGITVVEADPAPRPAHPESPDPEAPALTHDDLLRFHEVLATDDWFAQLR